MTERDDFDIEDELDDEIEVEFQEKDPPCPQCGSDDTAPIHQEPMWMGTDQSDPEQYEEPWYRCLNCRYKWRQGPAVS